MKKAFLTFPQRAVSYAPKINSRRLGHQAFRNIAYKSDGGGDDEDEEAAALLKKVKQAAKEEIETRGYQNADSVNNLIAEALKDLPKEQLRSYEQDKVKLETTLRLIAGEVEKISQRTAVVAEQKTDLVMRAMEEKNAEGVSQWDLVERAMKNKGKGFEGRSVVNLNVRAAVTMTTGNVVDETTNALPDGAIESMSMAEFVGKRRGNFFVDDIADRTVVQEVDQYKVWLEEGTEEGAFAIVAEGAVKPLVSATLVRNFATYKKVAGKYVVTEEFAKFRRNAYNIIRRIIMDKMLRDYAAILMTDLNAQAAGYVGTTLDDTIVAPTDLEAIAAVAAQIETLDFVPDVLILHPQDKWRLMLPKDSNGNFLFLNAATGVDGQSRLLGLRVVTTTRQTLGYFTLGESGTFKIEEEPITVRMGFGITDNAGTIESDFDHNRFRVIIETYFIDWIGTANIGSFVRAQFSTVKAALLKP